MMIRHSCLMIPVLLIAAPHSAWGANFFSWDADSWTTSRGDCDKRRGVLDTSTKHGGSASLRMEVVGSQQGTIGCDQFGNENLSPAVAWNSGTTIYHRFWMKISPTFDWGTTFKKLKASRSMGSSGGSTGYTLYLHKGQVALSECAECLPQGSGDNRLVASYDFNPATNPAVQNWQEYIVAVRLQTANNQDAALTLYVNGNPVGEQSGVRIRDCSSGCDNVRDANWGMFAQSFYPQLCSEGDACANGGYIWVDDLSEDDTWNSTIGSPAPPPPPPPSGPSAEAFCPGGAAPDPAVLFCDDFEDSGRLSSDYFEYGDDEGQFVPVAGEGLSGGHAMRALWEPGETGAGDLKVAFGRSPIGSNIASTQDFREIYWRVYVRTGPGWSGSPYKLSRATALVDTNWAQSFIAHVWTDGGDALLLDPASGTSEAGELATTTYNDFANLRWLGIARGVTPVFAASNDDRWYCVEAHVELNDPAASNGRFELWVDDALEAQRTALNWVGDYQDFGINTVMLENHWNGGAPGSRTRYLDNLVISSSRIGCGDGSSSVPSEPPQPPILLP